MFLKAVEQKAVEKDAQELHDDSDRQQQAAGAQPGPDAGANGQQKPNDDGVVDADFKEV
jgi:molecular chaperone DnaK